MHILCLSLTEGEVEEEEGREEAYVHVKFQLSGILRSCRSKPCPALEDLTLDYAGVVRGGGPHGSKCSGAYHYVT